MKILFEEYGYKTEDVVNILGDFLLSKLDKEKDKQREQQAAYWATFCGYKMMDADKTLKFANEAEKDTSKLSYTLQYVAEAYKMKEDKRLQQLSKTQFLLPSNSRLLYPAPTGRQCTCPGQRSTQGG